MARKSENKLKIVERAGTDALYIRGTIRGHSVFESTGTADRSIAEKFRESREADLWRLALEDKAPKKLKEKSFADAVESYLIEHPPSPTTAGYVSRLLDLWGHRPLSEINQEVLPEAYALLDAKAAGATRLRNVLTPLRSVLNHASYLNWCTPPRLRSPAVAQSRTPYLKPSEATALVRAAAPHLKPLIVFLIGTGARLSEALELEWRYVDLEGSQATIYQKSRPGVPPRERHVDLPPVVIQALQSIKHRSGLVFRPARKGKQIKVDGYLDTGRSSGGQIKTGWNAACGRAGLDGKWKLVKRPNHKNLARQFVPAITPHGCRHTYASWHYAVHKDLMKLREDGGWSQIRMCERYAKRVPEAHTVAIKAWLAGKVDLGFVSASDANDEKAA